MTTTQLVLVCCTVLTVAGIAAWTTTRIVLAEKEFAAERSYAAAELNAVRADAAAVRAAAEADSLVGRAVLVNTTGATAVRGVVHADLPDRLTLRDAAVLAGGKDAEAPAGGLLHILRGRIDLVQEISPPPPPLGVSPLRQLGVTVANEEAAQRDFVSEISSSAPLEGR